MFERPLAFLSVAVCISAAGIAVCQAQKTGPANSPPKGGQKYAPPRNPLSDALAAKRDPTELINPVLLPDFRDQQDPKLQREPKQQKGDLQAFGYNYFDAPRQIIDARRVYLRRYFTGGSPEGEREGGKPGRLGQTARKQDLNDIKPRQKGGYIPTQEELDAIDKLTAPQKLDLLIRQREHRLTDSEKRMYRSFLYPNGDMSLEDAQDPSRTLSDAQRVDLLIRQRDNKLTDAEKSIYSKFLYPESRKLTAEESVAVSSLSDSQRIDLLTRLRQNKVTEDEKRKYRSFLYPTELDRSAAGRSDESATLTDAQKLDLLLKQQQGNLTESDKAKYHSFLFPEGAMQKPTDQNVAPAEEQTVRNTQQPEAINAFALIADPLTQIYQNITATAPVNYQLGYGDTIVVRVWSPTLELKEFPVRVDERGGITLPVLGRFVIRGMATAQAENAMRAQVRRIYRDADLSITTSALRTMSVTLSGEVYAGGTYQVPAVATALNMVYSSGGPTEDGSLRKIEVRRRGKLVGSIDFYQFLITGDTNGDIDLQPGDLIFVPGRQNRVAVLGEVLHPAYYELLPSESLKDALKYAGGIKASGVNQRVQITTVQPGAARILKDVDARDDRQASSTKVYDGDTIEAFSLRTTVMNKVTIEGAVDQPAEYALNDKMTIADLIQRARGLTEDAYTSRADVFRYNPDNTLTRFQVNLEKALAHDPTENVPLSRWDLVRIYTRQQISWTGRREVTVRGAVKKPGIYYRSDNMKVKDLLVDSEGTLPEAYLERAALLHQRPDGTYSYDYISLALAIKDDPKHNIAVLDRDILAVYRHDEAAFTPEHTVTISGEVVTPSTYPRGEGMKLSDLLRLAGGLTPRAGDKIAVAHARTGQNTAPTAVAVSGPAAIPTPDPLLEDGDVVTIQGIGDYHNRPYIVTVSGAVNRPGPIALHGKMVRLTEIIKEAGGLKPEAYPQGIEFTRNTDLMASSGQKGIADIINQLNDLINQSTYKRELAKSDIEQLRAYGSAVRGGPPIGASLGAIGGLIGGSDSGSVSPSAAASSRIFGRDLVAQPRVLTKSDLEPNGNVAVNLASAMEKPGSEDDVLMMDGDQVSIPERPTTVQVIGAVYHPRGVLYRPGEKIGYFIDRVGGFAPDAAKDKVIIIRLGGGLIPLNKAKSFEPGDVILVPTRVLADRISNRSSEIDNIFRNITSTSLIVLLGTKLLGL